MGLSALKAIAKQTKLRQLAVGAEGRAKAAVAARPTAAPARGWSAGPKSLTRRDYCYGLQSSLEKLEAAIPERGISARSLGNYLDATLEALTQRLWTAPKLEAGAKAKMLTASEARLGTRALRNAIYEEIIAPQDPTRLRGAHASRGPSTPIDPQAMSQWLKETLARSLAINGPRTVPQYRALLG